MGCIFMLCSIATIDFVHGRPKGVSVASSVGSWVWGVGCGVCSIATISLVHGNP